MSKFFSKDSFIWLHIGRIGDEACKGILEGIYNDFRVSKSGGEIIGVDYSTYFDEYQKFSKVIADNLFVVSSKEWKDESYTHGLLALRSTGIGDIIKFYLTKHLGVVANMCNPKHFG